MTVEELKLTTEKTPMAYGPQASKRKKNSQRLIGFLCAAMVLIFCFSVPLYNLMRLAAGDDLYSDIPLIPLVSLYLIWLRRENLPRSFKTASGPAAIFFAAGLAILMAYWLPVRDAVPAVATCLAFNIFAFLLILTGVCFLFFGKVFMHAIACPMVLLIFIVPLPVPVRHWVETFLQHGSAVFAGMFFQLSGTPVMRDGLIFHLPNINLEVAPECSGIHSTMVLTIVSIVGAVLFLRSPWKRMALILAVVPLALIRNGFRIFIIGHLCVNYGPQMLASPIHRHGGPLFFILSLIPFFLFLILLKKSERTSCELSTK
jgi:exosortase C (VPDSG-CTERM-specific)